jgi:hypothetical protein
VIGGSRALLPSGPASPLARQTTLLRLSDSLSSIRAPLATFSNGYRVSRRVHSVGSACAEKPALQSQPASAGVRARDRLTGEPVVEDSNWPE